MITLDYDLSRKRARIPESLAPKSESCTLGYDELGSDATTKVPLEIGDTEKVLAYYESAFRAFQQINCRQIAKAYIKIIEPRKQVKFPYNGGKGGPGEKGDPEKTKPEWWPAGVIHREPDHLKKPGKPSRGIVCLALTCSLINNLEQNRKDKVTYTHISESTKNPWNQCR